jgi:hypothetical protein
MKNRALALVKWNEIKQLPETVDAETQLVDVNMQITENKYLNSIKKEYYYTNDLNNLETQEIIDLMYEKDYTIDISNFELEGILNLESYTDKYVGLTKLLCAGNNFTTIICPETPLLTQFEFESLFIEIIKFPIIYNSSLDFLSETISKIIFPTKSLFNKKINDLPNSLKLLVLGNKFNNQLNNLPDNLEVLFVGTEFNQDLNNLPSKLKILHFDFGSAFNSQIKNLPSKIKHLSLPSDKYNYQIFNTFNNCVKIKSGTNYFYAIN